ncbi:ABC transporter [Sarcoptes scabiei]|nr:ABC transporter [Sarcoptes scabiei]
MGQAFSEPVTEKKSSTEKNDKFLVASSSIQGWRISMEDAHTIMLSMPDDPEASFFAVFDGHGGSKVASFAAENLHRGLCSNQQYKDGKIEDALKTIFMEFDEMMFNDEKMRDELAGSTAVVILIKNNQIYCANIGDSRAVASFMGRVDPLSIDHKPTCESEMNRIVTAGGWVQFNRVNGNLALSRAFGDFVFKRNDKRSATEQIVIAYPDVQTRTISSDLEFIVLACDGVWDVMTNEEVVEFIRKRVYYRKEPIAICEELITRCLAPDCQMGCGIGCDNMTVILICYLNGSTFEEFCDRISNCYVMTPDQGHHIGPVNRFKDAYNHNSNDSPNSSSSDYMAHNDENDDDDDDDEEDDDDDDENDSDDSRNDKEIEKNKSNGLLNCPKIDRDYHHHSNQYDDSNGNEQLKNSESSERNQAKSKRMNLNLDHSRSKSSSSSSVAALASISISKPHKHTSSLSPVQSIAAQSKQSENRSNVNEFSSNTIKSSNSAA